MNFFYKIDDWLTVFEKILIVFFFSILIFLTTFNILTRNLFHHSFAWILEYSPAFVVWLCLMGATLAFRRQGHIKLELLLRYCPARFRFFANIASGVFGMVVMSILMVVALEFVKNEIDFQGVRGGLSAIFPLFFIIAVFRYFMQILTNAKALINPPDAATCDNSVGEGAKQ